MLWIEAIPCSTKSPYWVLAAVSCSCSASYTVMPSCGTGMVMLIDVTVFLSAAISFEGSSASTATSNKDNRCFIFKKKCVSLVIIVVINNIVYGIGKVFFLFKVYVCVSWQVLAETRTCQLKRDLHYSYPPQYVVEVGHNHKQEQDAYADVFGPDHKVLAGLAARNHFVQQEQHVPAIKGRNG